MKKKILGIIALLVGFQLSAFSFQLSHSYALQLVPNVSGVGASSGYAYRISGNKALWTPSSQSILTTQGDILFRGVDSTLLERLGAGTSGHYLKTQGAGANPVWAATTAHQSSRVIRTAGNLTTTSATFADATGMSITLTTGANPVLIGISGGGTHSVSSGQCRVDIDIDGSRQGQAVGLIAIGPGAVLGNISFVYQSATLTAASHTFKMQIATDQATATFNASSDQPLIFWVTEVK